MDPHCHNLVPWKPWLRRGGRVKRTWLVLLANSKDTEEKFKVPSMVEGIAVCSVGYLEPDVKG